MGFGVMRRIILLASLMIATSSPGEAATDNALLKMQEGASAMLRGKFDQAVASYDLALKEKDLPPSRLASIHNDRGVANWRLARNDEALKDLNRSIELYGESATAFNNRGNILLDLGRADDALADFTKAVSLAPGYGAAYNNRGNANLQLGKHDAAVEDYKRAMALMPNNAVPFNRGTDRRAAPDCGNGASRGGCRIDGRRASSAGL
jgi:tetratricopeptide (TPR) repeat protein